MNMEEITLQEFEEQFNVLKISKEKNMVDDFLKEYNYSYDNVVVEDSDRQKVKSDNRYFYDVLERADLIVDTDNDKNKRPFKKGEIQYKYDPKNILIGS